MTRAENGFSLVEVVVALVITGALIGAALSLVSAELRASQNAANYVVAAALAEDVLEDLSLAGRGDGVRLGVAATGPFPRPLNQYRWVAQTNAVPDERALIALTVTVWWAGGSVSATTRLPAGNPQFP